MNFKPLIFALGLSTFLSGQFAIAVSQSPNPNQSPNPAPLPRPNCDSVFVGPLTHIFREMEQEKVTTVFSEPENINSFLNQCVLVSAVYVAEAMNRLTNPQHKLPAYEWLARAKEILPQLSKASTRRQTGLNLYEAQALAKFFARNLGLDTVQFKATTKIDKSVMPQLDSDLTMLGTKVIGESGLHMIVGYHFFQNRLLAMDPITGRTAVYDVVFLTDGIIHLNNLTRTTGPGINLTIVSAIKVMMMKASNHPDYNDTIESLEALHQQLVKLTFLLKNPYPLIQPDKLGNDPVAAGHLVHNLFQAFNEATDILKQVDPLKLLPNVSEAASVFELRLKYLEIEELKKSTGTIEWLENRGFLEPDKTKTQVPVTLGQSLPQLEADLPAEFKVKRKIAIDTAMKLLEKGSIDHDDIIYNLRRVLDPYIELVLEINKKLPTKDSHRALSSYYEVLKKLMNSKVVKDALEGFDPVFANLIQMQWQTIEESRAKFELK